MREAIATIQCVILDDANGHCYCIYEGDTRVGIMVLKDSELRKVFIEEQGMLYEYSFTPNPENPKHPLQNPLFVRLPMAKRSSHMNKRVLNIVKIFVDIKLHFITSFFAQADLQLFRDQAAVLEKVFEGTDTQLFHDQIVELKKNPTEVVLQFFRNWAAKPKQKQSHPRKLQPKYDLANFDELKALVEEEVNKKFVKSNEKQERDLSTVQVKHNAQKKAEEKAVKKVAEKKRREDERQANEAVRRNADRIQKRIALREKRKAEVIFSDIQKTISSINEQRDFLIAQSFILKKAALEKARIAVEKKGMLTNEASIRTVFVNSEQNDFNKLILAFAQFFILYANKIIKAEQDIFATFLLQKIFIEKTKPHTFILHDEEKAFQEIRMLYLLSKIGVALVKTENVNEIDLTLRLLKEINKQINAKIDEFHRTYGLSARYNLRRIKDFRMNVVLNFIEERKKYVVTTGVSPKTSIGCDAALFSNQTVVPTPPGLINNAVSP